MVGFICMGLLDLSGARSENYKMKNFCPHWDSNPGHSAYEANSLTIVLLDEMSIEHLNVDRVLPESAFKIYLCHVPRIR